MERIYTEHLRVIHSTSGSNCFANTVRCARRACGGDIAPGERAWRVSYNSSSGWASRIAHVHPECGRVMTYRTSRGYVPATDIRPVDER